MSSLLTRRAAAKKALGSGNKGKRKIDEIEHEESAKKKGAGSKATQPTPTLDLEATQSLDFGMDDAGSPLHKKILPSQDSQVLLGPSSLSTCSPRSLTTTFLNIPQTCGRM